MTNGIGCRETLCPRKNCPGPECCLFDRKWKSQTKGNIGGCCRCVIVGGWMSRQECVNGVSEIVCMKLIISFAFWDRMGSAGLTKQGSSFSSLQCRRQCVLLLNYAKSFVAIENNFAYSSSCTIRTLFKNMKLQITDLYHLDRVLGKC